MQRANRMCPTCPFRGADDTYKRECAAMQAEDWPCHTEQVVYGITHIQCRGHFEAQRAAQMRKEKDDRLAAD